MRGIHLGFIFLALAWITSCSSAPPKLSETTERQRDYKKGRALYTILNEEKKKASTLSKGSVTIVRGKKTINAISLEQATKDAKDGDLIKLSRGRFEVPVFTWKFQKDIKIVGQGAGTVILASSEESHCTIELYEGDSDSPCLETTVIPDELDIGLADASKKNLRPNVRFEKVKILNPKFVVRLGPAPHVWIVDSEIIGHGKYHVNKKKFERAADRWPIEVAIASVGSRAVTTDALTSTHYNTYGMLEIGEINIGSGYFNTGNGRHKSDLDKWWGKKPVPNFSIPPAKLRKQVNSFKNSKKSLDRKMYREYQAYLKNRSPEETMKANKLLASARKRMQKGEYLSAAYLAYIVERTSPSLASKAFPVFKSAIEAAGKKHYCRLDLSGDHSGVKSSAKHSAVNSHRPVTMQRLSKNFEFLSTDCRVRWNFDTASLRYSGEKVGAFPIKAYASQGAIATRDEYHRASKKLMDIRTREAEAARERAAYQNARAAAQSLLNTASQMRDAARMRHKYRTKVTFGKTYTQITGLVKVNQAKVPSTKSYSAALPSSGYPDPASLPPEARAISYPTDKDVDETLEIMKKNREVYKKQDQEFHYHVRERQAAYQAQGLDSRSARLLALGKASYAPETTLRQFYKISANISLKSSLWIEKNKKPVTAKQNGEWKSSNSELVQEDTGKISRKPDPEQLSEEALMQTYIANKFGPEINFFNQSRRKKAKENFAKSTEAKFEYLLFGGEADKFAVDGESVTSRSFDEMVTRYLAL